MDKLKVLLLVGSPKKEHSTSNSIGKYLIKNLEKENCIDNTIYIYDSLKNDFSCKEMINTFNESDVIILSYPLYVDSLPANCIKALEYIKEERQKINFSKNQSFLAIGNCGFYEKEQIKNSLNVCKFFAKENNINWYGGISIGGGPQFQGKDLISLGSMTSKIRQGLDIVSNSILQGNDIPMDKVNDLLSIPQSKSIYFMQANLSFKHEAKKNGILENIDDKPYVTFK